VLLKGANAENEIAAAEKVIRRYKLTDVRVETVGEGSSLSPPASFARHGLREHRALFDAAVSRETSAGSGRDSAVIVSRETSTH
jgi:hypothetical protein